MKNLSSVIGATVTDALNTLSGTVGALTTSSIANVSVVAGATATAALNTLAAAIAALTTTSIANVSGVAGATATAALNTLAAAITALTTTSIANVSGVAGATTTAALNTLAAAITALSASTTTSLATKAARDGVWDPPTVANALDVEFNTDVLLAGSWTIRLSGGAVLTRDGGIDLTQAVASGHYRSSVRGGSLWVQLKRDDNVIMYRDIGTALTSHLIWMLGGGFQTEIGTGNTNDPAFSLWVAKNAAGVPDGNNRSIIGTGSSADRYTLTNIVASVSTALSTNTLNLMPIEGLALRVNHGSAAAGNITGFGFMSRSKTISTPLGGNGVQFNASTDKNVIGMRGNTAASVTGADNVLFNLQFLRAVNVAAGLWISQD